ncbi:MAG: Hpt domain-containing protein [Pseudomonadota bacterium]
MNSRRDLKPATEAHILRLKAQFVDTFAARADQIEQWQDRCLADPPDRDALKKLRTEVHQLRGSAGLYDLKELFEEFDVLQGELDTLLGQWPPRGLTAESRHRLHRVLQLMRFPGRFL